MKRWVHFATDSGRFSAMESHCILMWWQNLELKVNKENDLFVGV